jgi:hypothetical protein
VLEQVWPPSILFLFSFFPRATSSQSAAAGQRRRRPEHATGDGGATMTPLSGTCMRP